MPVEADAACTLSTRLNDDGHSSDKTCTDALKVELQFLHQVHLRWLLHDARLVVVPSSHCY